MLISKTEIKNEMGLNPKAITYWAKAIADEMQSKYPDFSYIIEKTEQIKELCEQIIATAEKLRRENTEDYLHEILNHEVEYLE